MPNAIQWACDRHDCVHVCTSKQLIQCVTYLAGNVSAVEGGAAVRGGGGGVEGRVGVDVDGVEPAVALEEALPQRRSSWTR